MPQCVKIWLILVINIFYFISKYIGSGRVFMFGLNNWGQLGIGHEKNVEKPSCVKGIKNKL